MFSVMAPEYGSLRAAPFVVVFFRDGAVFYAMILAGLLSNLILFKATASPLSSFATCLYLTTFSVSCSRLILNIRTPFNHEESSPRTLPTLRFRRTVPQSTTDIELESTHTRDARQQ